jgi:hypothetical protein
VVSFAPEVPLLPILALLLGNVQLLRAVLPEVVDLVVFFNFLDLDLGQIVGPSDDLAGSEVVTEVVELEGTVHHNTVMLVVYRNLGGSFYSV